MKCAINSFEYQSGIGEQGVKEIIDVLNGFSNTVIVEDKQKDKEFQKLGIDLLCLTKERKGIGTHTIEVKTTLYPEDKYFLETISNDRNNSPGSFITSKSEWMFYYFKNDKKLHMTLTKQIQYWLYNNGHQYDLKACKTTDKTGKVYLYSSKGRIVPFRDICKDIPVWIYDLNTNCLYR